MSDDYDDADMSALQGLDILPWIIRNSAIYLLCEDESDSQWGHDFRTCKCGNLSVDGGRAYTTRVYRMEGSWRDTSVFGRGKEGDGMAVEDGR